jgi:hypothetical protein
MFFSAMTSIFELYLCEKEIIIVFFFLFVVVFIFFFFPNPNELLFYKKKIALNFRIDLCEQLFSAAIRLDCNSDHYKKKIMASEFDICQKYE